jgi:SAM-dependent methyltransferase
VDLWSLKSSVYERGRSLPPFRQILRAEKRNLRELTRGISPGPGPVVDIGSGLGTSLDVLPECGFLVCMDRASGMVRRIHGAPAAVVRAEALSLPLRDRSVSLVSAVGLLEYIENRDLFLSEIKRVLRDGGLFLCTLSQPGFLNALRNLLGSRIHAVRSEAWEASINSMGFRLRGKRESLIQIQYLLEVQSR